MTADKSRMLERWESDALTDQQLFTLVEIRADYLEVGTFREELLGEDVLITINGEKHFLITTDGNHHDLLTKRG